MDDREKVVGHLNDCIEASRRDNTWVFVRKDIVEDAIAILKEQKAVAIVWKFGFPHCPVCGQMLPEGDAVKYCLHCGRSVKWECL